MTPQQWHECIDTNQKGQFAQANYAATKAGDIGFTKALAQEGARAGITVNVVAPGYINTEMMSTIPEKVMNEVILPQIPVGRLGEASEIARTVAFLTSDDAWVFRSEIMPQNVPKRGISADTAAKR